MADMDGVLCRMPGEMAEDLKAMAERNDRTRAAEIRRAVEFYLNNEAVVVEYFKDKRKSDGEQR